MPLHAATTTTKPDPTKIPPDVGRCTFKPRPCYKVPLSGMLWMGAREMFRTLKCSTVSEKIYWTCDTCSASLSQQSPPPKPSPPLSPAPPTEQISDDSTFNVLQLNANEIGNKLTDVGVVVERNKVKVAVIQDSKLSPKSKNPCIQNYTRLCKDRSYGQGGGLLIFIHRSITFSKQPSSTESLSDPHLEELSIKAELVIQT